MPSKFNKYFLNTLLKYSTKSFKLIQKYKYTSVLIATQIAAGFWGSPGAKAFDVLYESIKEFWTQEKKKEQITIFINKLAKKCSSTKNMTDIKKEFYENLQELEEAAVALELQKIRKYYLSLKGEELKNCATLFFMLSMYYTSDLSNMSQGKKYAKLGKEAIESYIIARERDILNENFITQPNSMVIKVMTTEIIDKDIPKIYSRILYSLGRILILQNKYEISQKYFELAKSLSEQHQLFELILCDTTGIGLIDNNRIKKLLKQKKYNIAEKKIRKNIEIYKKKKSEDINKYELFKCQDEDSIDLTVLEHKLECDKRLLEYYTHLATVKSLNSEPIENIVPTVLKIFERKDDVICVVADRLKCEQQLLKYLSGIKSIHDESIENIIIILKGQENENGMIGNINENKYDNKKKISTIDTIAHSLLDLEKTKMDVQKIYKEVLKLNVLHNKGELNLNSNLYIIRDLFLSNQSTAKGVLLANTHDGLAKVQIRILETFLLQCDIKSSMIKEVNKDISKCRQIKEYLSIQVDDVYEYDSIFDQIQISTSHVPKLNYIDSVDFLPLGGDL